MSEKTNAELLQILSRKIYHGDRGGALSNERVAYQTWLKKNTGIKYDKTTGKKITVWKVGANKGKLFDPTIGSKQFNKEYYGSTTPRKDLNYLQEVERSNIRIKNLRGDSIRTKLSKKDYLGNNIFQQEVDVKEESEKKRLKTLRIDTSFGREDVRNRAKLLSEANKTTQLPIPSDETETSEQSAIADEEYGYTGKPKSQTGTPSGSRGGGRSQGVGSSNTKLVAPVIPPPKVESKKVDPNKWGVNEKELKRRTGMDLKEFGRAMRTNQVFDTTQKFGTDKGGFFVPDVHGVPRFIPHRDRGKK